MSYDVNLVIEDTGKVLGATLGSLVEKLTSAPIQEVPVFRNITPRQPEKPTTGPSKRRRAKSDAPLRKINSHSDDFSAPKKKRRFCRATKLAPQFRQIPFSFSFTHFYKMYTRRYKSLLLKTQG